MFETHIYISTDSTSPTVMERYYGYVLECVTAGTTKTKEGFGKASGSYHQIILTALTEALDRFRKPCEVTVHTEDAFILNMLEHNLEVWAGNDFTTNKGKPVANKDQWKDVWRLSQRHLILTEPGKHAYSGWLWGEIKKRKEKHNV